MKENDFFFLITDNNSQKDLENNATMLVAKNTNQRNFSWHYVRCPPENECLNGHHTCSPKSEKCFDLDEGFECMCGDGFKTET